MLYGSGPSVTLDKTGTGAKIALAPGTTYLLPGAGRPDGANQHRKRR
jgi:hypothetical protein